MRHLADPVDPGDVRQLLLKEHAKPGSIPQRQIGVYRPVRTEHPDGCKHLDTICRTCLPEWNADYHVRRFEHGSVTAYRTYGCRCQTCRHGISTRTAP